MPRLVFPISTAYSGLAPPRTAPCLAHSDADDDDLVIINKNEEAEDHEKVIAESFSDADDDLIIINKSSPENKKSTGERINQNLNNKDKKDDYYITKLVAKQMKNLHELKVKPIYKEDKLSKTVFNFQKKPEELLQLGNKLEILLEKASEVNQEKMKVKKVKTSQDKSWKGFFRTTRSIIAEAAASGLVFLEQYRRRSASTTDINASNRNKIR